MKSAHIDITSRTRDDFDTFVGAEFLPAEPVNNSKVHTKTFTCIFIEDTTRNINATISSPPDDDTYLVSNTEQRNNFKSLIDRGANGGIAGDDMRLICHDTHGRTIDVQGIDNHEIPKLKISSCGAVARTQRGDAILIFNQYAHHGRGKSIHSALQLEDNSVKVDDRPSSSL